VKFLPHFMLISKFQFVPVYLSPDQRSLSSLPKVYVDGAPDESQNVHSTIVEIRITRTMVETCRSAIHVWSLTNVVSKTVTFWFELRKFYQPINHFHTLANFLKVK
jgi:hypothetical protein